MRRAPPKRSPRIKKYLQVWSVFGLSRELPKILLIPDILPRPPNMIDVETPIKRPPMRGGKNFSIKNIILDRASLKRGGLMVKENGINKV